jgi:hypothetical protein
VQWRRVCFISAYPFLSFPWLFVYSGVAVEHVDPITLGRTTGFADAIGERVTVC